MEKKMETTIVYWDYIGITEQKMETTIVYWDYVGIMEKKMETTSRVATCARIPTMVSLRGSIWNEPLATDLQHKLNRGMLSRVGLRHCRGGSCCR